MFWSRFCGSGEAFHAPQKPVARGGISLHVNRSPESGAVTRSALVLRRRPGRSSGPGLLPPKVGAGDDPGQDAQTAPQRLLLLGGVLRRPLVSRWVPSVGPSHSAPGRGSRRQTCGRRSRRVSASSIQCERRDGRSEPPMRGCMYAPCSCMHPLMGSARIEGCPHCAQGVRGIGLSRQGVQIDTFSFETEQKQAPTECEQEALSGKCSFRRAYARSLAENRQLGTT